MCVYIYIYIYIGSPLPLPLLQRPLALLQHLLPSGLGGPGSEGYLFIYMCVYIIYSIHLSLYIYIYIIYIYIYICIYIYIYICIQLWLVTLLLLDCFYVSCCYAFFVCLPGSEASRKRPTICPISQLRSSLLRFVDSNRGIPYRHENSTPEIKIIFESNPLKSRIL